MPKRKRPSNQVSNGAAVDCEHHHHHHQQQRQSQDVKSSNEAGASVTKKSKAPKKKTRKRKKSYHLLKGLTLAVTALDEKRTDDKEADDTSSSSALPSSSYKHIIEKCIRHGAVISGQVHRRVHALIVSDAAVRNASQRVRKAIKLRIPIVDAGWIEACADSGSRVEWTEYLRDDEAREAAEAKEAANVADITGSDQGCDVKFDIGQDDANAMSGWTDAVELDCCCVCHENGDLGCPWCTGDKECNLTKRRLNK